MHGQTRGDLAELIGGTIVDVLTDDEYAGFLIKCSDGKERTAWILSDAEGNGAGHIDVAEVDV